MKRKPLKGSVRIPRHIDGNFLFTITNKAGRLVECESFNERKFVLLQERDPETVDYISQPEKFLWVDELGKKHTYVPDFKVMRLDGSIEIHEITIEQRRKEKLLIQQRELAAQAICKAQSWKYVVHTEKTLPSETKLANLLALYCYRARAYFNPQVSRAIEQLLDDCEPHLINPIIAEVVKSSALSQPIVTSTLFNMLWHGELETDWHVLLFHDASPSRHAQVWLNS